MPEELADRLDAFADEHDHTGRSEVVRESARLLLTEFVADVVSVDYSIGPLDTPETLRNG
ncbi:CopG family transcriptional regulator [Halobiforma nitratireducens JCM 10879]|uniref:CopG family transcriptional regulator n=1 Tax=Halobiforma nitratireducens JCM 10879 TaxID=1227454 RepID=M0LDU2_9EURY|nr:CopG family transcriptional regulator [Halobiforma nitratireducens JCM 10879]